MMRSTVPFHLVLIVTFLPMAGGPTARADDRPPGAPRSWSGTVADAKLLKAAPASGKGLSAGFVGDSEAWAAVWRAWAGDDAAPFIDFGNELVLVFTAVGPNTISNPKLTLEAGGKLVATSDATLKPGGGFAYRFSTVRREGIASVNGSAVGKPHPADIDLAALQGAWKPIRVATGDAAGDAAILEVKVVVAGNELTAPGLKWANTFKLDPTASPKEIDLFQDGTLVTRGIYQFKKGELTLCLGATHIDRGLDGKEKGRSAGDRPSKFVGGGVALVTLQKVAEK